MKPQNKFQRQIVEASKSLPKITDAQVRWGYLNAIQYTAHRSANGAMTCTRCGHKWHGTGYLVDILTECHCPNCNAKLTVKTYKKRVIRESYYMTIITAHKGYQVLRTVMLKYTVKIGEQPQCSHSEVMQRWIAPDGRYCTFAKLRQTMGTCCIDLWLWHTPLELRAENSNNKFCMNVYDRIYTGEIYPRIKLIPELKRTGFTKNFHEQKPFDLFRVLLTDSRYETLLKTRQIALLECFLKDNNRNPDNYWASIRIVMRNGYKIKDASSWLDYIDFLRYMGKDLHNARYVCPADLNAEHDRYMSKVAKKEQREENPKMYKSKALQYVVAKKRYLGLQFTDGQITVKVINSVDEMALEGKAMHHCVAKYHEKEDSLILSATIDGKRIETVEVSLSKLSVIQCRGACNQDTPYHKQIIDLVGRNMHLIEQRQAA